MICSKSRVKSDLIDNKEREFIKKSGYYTLKNKRKKKKKIRKVSIQIDLLSPNNEPALSTSFDANQTIKKSNNTHFPTQHQLSAIGSISSRVYKCIRCQRLAPHRWIIERHIRAKHPLDSDHMSNVILEINKSLSSSTSSTTNGEPMTATKSSSSATFGKLSSSDLVSTLSKAFSCSACSLQSYHLWVILRHIRNVHHNDGSNAKIIDNINNQVKKKNVLFSFFLYLFVCLFKKKKKKTK